MIRATFGRGFITVNFLTEEFHRETSNEAEPKKNKKKRTNLLDYLALRKITLPLNPETESRRSK